MRTRLGISAISASGTAANMMETPNSRRREKPRRMRSPRNIPMARPKKMAANTAPQPGAAALQDVPDVGRAEPDDDTTGREGARSCRAMMPRTT